MSTLLRYAAALILLSLLPSAKLARAQGKPSTASLTPSNFAAGYPNDDASVLVDSGWVALSQELPSKIRTKRGLVSSLTYGVVPGAIIAEYPGQHAGLQIETHRPAFSICNVPSFAGAPALVRLHPKKDSRELDASRLPSWAPRSRRPSSLIRFRQKQYSRKMVVGSCAHAKTSRPVSML